MRHRLSKLPLRSLLLAGGTLVSACGPGVRRPNAGRQAPARRSVSASPTSVAVSTFACPVAVGSVTLALRSSFWLNLHDFLLKESKRRRGIADEAPGAFRAVAEDTAGTRPLTAVERREWARALDGYDRAMRDDRRSDDVFVVLNARLADAGPVDRLDDVALAPPFPSSLAEALRVAAPVYRAIWWPTHDRQNRAWIASMRAQLDRHGDCLLRREAALLGGRWPVASLPVDASVYASWFGAYTTLDPLHVTVSSAAVGTRGTLGLEVLLHEAGHTVLGAVDSALAATSARRHRRLPTELSHLLLFYTAGALVRSVEPAHVPYAESFGVWRQNRTALRYRSILERAWGPYVDGRGDFAGAIDRVVRELDPR